MSSDKPTKVRFGVFGALLVLCTINYVDRAVLSICMPSIQKDLNFDPTTVGLVLSSFFWGYAAMQIPSGWLLDRFKPDKIIGISAALWGVFQIITGFVSNSTLFMGLRVLLGVSESPIYPGGSKLQSVWLTSKERGRGAALLDCGSALGNAVGGPLVILFVAWFDGWRGALIGAGIVTLLFAGLCWRFIQGTPETNRKVNQAERDYLRKALAEEYEAANAGGAGVNTGIKDYFYSRNFWCMIVAFCAMDAYFYGLMTWGPSFLAATNHIDIKGVGWSVFVIFGTGAIVELIGGVITDKWQQSGTNVNTVFRTLLCILGIGMAGSMFFLTRATSLTEAIVCLSLGLGFVRWTGMLTWMLPSMIAQRKDIGTVAGTMNFVGNMAGIATPIGVGLIVSVTGSYYGALMMFMGFGLLVLIAGSLFTLGKKVGAEQAREAVAA